MALTFHLQDKKRAQPPSIKQTSYTTHQTGLFCFLGNTNAGSGNTGFQMHYITNTRNFGDLKIKKQSKVNITCIFLFFQSEVQEQRCTLPHVHRNPEELGVLEFNQMTPHGLLPLSVESVFRPHQINTTRFCPRRDFSSPCRNIRKSSRISRQ